MEERAAGGSAPLNLSVPPNSHKRTKRGLKGITSYGRSMVKSFGALLNRDFPNHRVTLGTLTIPPLPQAERAALVEGWSEFVRQLLQFLARRLAAAEVPQIVCSVTEIQPKRLRRANQGYLHVHVLWLNVPARHGSWSISPKDVSAWGRRYLERKFPTANIGHVNCNVKPARGDAARYLAKYMSKGAEELTAAQADWGVDACPSTWWNMTRAARDWVKSNVHRGLQVGKVLEMILDYTWDTGDTRAIAYLRKVETEYDGATLTMGYIGRLERGIHRELDETLKSA